MRSVTLAEIGRQIQFLNYSRMLAPEGLRSWPSAFSLCPTCTIASRAGTSCMPRFVNEYSTEGGDVGCTVRMSTPRCCSSLSRADNTLAEIGGMSIRNSLNRRGPARKDQMTLGAHAPAITAIHSVNRQGSGGAGLLFRRTFNAIEVSR